MDSATPYPREYAYCPSLNGFFEGLVCNWTGGTVGVLLTGFGRDGAEGLKLLSDKSYSTIARNEWNPWAQTITRLDPKLPLVHAFWLT